MRRSTAAICSLAILSGAGSAVAGERYEGETVYAQGWYLTGMGGFMRYDSERNLERETDTWGYGVGYQFNSNYAAELVYARQDTATDPGNAEVDGKIGRLDVFKYFGPRGRTQPFMLLGMGDLDLKGSGAAANRNETFVNFGGGFRYRVNDRLSLRWDARAIRSLDENITEYGTNLAVIYAFDDAYKVASAAPRPEPEPVIGDADGDGVMDDKDQCPDTPKNLQVNKRDCPILTREGVEIDLHVEFDFDKSVVKDQYMPRIEAVADFMKKYPATSTTLEGHTDSIGPDSYNQGLSERRANAVRNIFIERFGISGDRLKAVGYGESKPIADNSTKEGRDRNRRTTAVIKTTRSRYKQRDAQ